MPDDFLQPQVISVKELLSKNITIPDYQRPYKWTQRNVIELLDDILKAIEDSRKYTDFKYRIGTVILFKKDDKNDGKEYDEIYEVVDGQQRLITLTLICMVLDVQSFLALTSTSFNSKVSQKNIQDNYSAIKNWMKYHDDKKDDILKSLESILQFVVIGVRNISEAFQLFDSQNHRGKPLDPHALLKAYHLREMKDSPYEMVLTVNKWEERDPQTIRELFNSYLYPIWKWSKILDAVPFTAKEIDVYKGIIENSSYSYAKRALKASPCFQVTEPFTAGRDFFEFVDHYLNLLDTIKNELQTNGDFQKIAPLLIERKKYSAKKYEGIDLSSAGFCYAKNLFYCALFCYYDRFHNFNKMVVEKLFVWAFMLRVDMENLGEDSVNLYALGREGKTNTEPMFFSITNARREQDVANIQISVKRNSGGAKSSKWDSLYNYIKCIYGEVD